MSLGDSRLESTPQGQQPTHQGHMNENDKKSRGVISIPFQTDFKSNNMSLKCYGKYIYCGRCSVSQITQFRRYIFRHKKYKKHNRKKSEGLIYIILSLLKCLGVYFYITLYPKVK